MFNLQTDLKKHETETTSARDRDHWPKVETEMRLRPQKIGLEPVSRPSSLILSK